METELTLMEKKTKEFGLLPRSTLSHDQGVSLLYRIEEFDYTEKRCPL